MSAVCECSVWTWAVRAGHGQAGSCRQRRGSSSAGAQPGGAEHHIALLCTPIISAPLLFFMEFRHLQAGCSSGVAAAELLLALR